MPLQEFQNLCGGSFKSVQISDSIWQEPMKGGDESVQAAFGKGKGARAGKQCGEDHLGGLFECRLSFVQIQGLEYLLAIPAVLRTLFVSKIDS